MGLTISHQTALNLTINRRQKRLLFTVKRKKFLALINRAGGLYGRILTEGASRDRTQ